MTLGLIVGSRHGVTVEVAVWDGARANVALSCVAMFNREKDGAALKGGLAHVDAALRGQLRALRKDGHFGALAGETLLISSAPSSIVADALLIVGLGDPHDWSPSVLATAVAAAARTAIALRVESAAFAPGMLDSGLEPDQAQDASVQMAQGLVAALDQNARLRQLGFAPPPTLRRWTFDVGAPRYARAAEQFRSAFEHFGNTQKVR